MIIDDSLATGNLSIDVSASTVGLQTATAAIQVVDDEIASLNLTLPSSSVAENGGTITASISRNTPDTEDLLVNLSSSESAKVTVPSSVIIPRGSSTASFTVTIIDDSQYQGDITALLTASASGLIAGTASLLVKENEVNFPWHNSRNALDVNDDGFVTPIDALLVINYLNTGAPSLLPVPKAGENAPPPYLDVSRDGSASAIDALLVINRLNQPTSAEGERSILEEIANQVFSDLDWVESLRKLTSRR